MDIQILHLAEGAKRAVGLTVIIDVFRAFTVEPWLMSRNAQCILPVGEVAQAFACKKQFPQAILCGERNGIMVEGFDYGNSPSQFEHTDLGRIEKFTPKPAKLTEVRDVLIKWQNLCQEHELV